MTGRSGSAVDSVPADPLGLLLASTRPIQVIGSVGGGIGRHGGFHDGRKEHVHLLAEALDICATLRALADLQQSQGPQE